MLKEPSIHLSRAGRITDDRRLVTNRAEWCEGRMVTLERPPRSGRDRLRLSSDRSAIRDRLTCTSILQVFSRHELNLLLGDGGDQKRQRDIKRDRPYLLGVSHNCLIIHGLVFVIGGSERSWHPIHLPGRAGENIIKRTSAHLAGASHNSAHNKLSS